MRKKVTLEIDGQDISLKGFTCEEKENLLCLVQEYPQLLNFYILRELMRMRKRLDREMPDQWTQKYEYNLNTAQTNKLIDQFPTRGAKYLYVKEATGTVTLRFDSQNEPSFTLTTKDQFRMPFDALYLSWTAQEEVKLIFYISNRRIKRTTLA